MKKILGRIGKVTKRIAVAAAALVSAQHKWTRQHDIAARAHDKAVKTRHNADILRSKGKPGAAKRADNRAIKLAVRSDRYAAKAQQSVARIKVRAQRKGDLKEWKAQLEAQLEAWKREHGVQISGDKVTGGTPEKRLQVCQLESAHRCSTGRRRNFYSQSGAYDVDNCLTGPPYGHRDDCSSWFASVYKSCGLPDPNGQGYGSGYTGTLVANGKQITRGEAMHTPGAAVIFGYGPGHHVEMAVGDGTERTTGHGSAPVDAGTFSLLPGPVRFFKYDH